MITTKSLLILSIAVTITVGGYLFYRGVGMSNPSEQQLAEHEKEIELAQGDGLQKATFGNGCFWCTEAVFQELKGVKAVFSGYSGGTQANPTYEEVCSGTTGHAEVVQITFDPKIVSFETLLEVFWKTHDPTTLNRQGPDSGTQYRSVVFYHTEEQKKLAEFYKAKLDEANAFPAPIVTEITRFEKFFAAEIDHQNFYNNNGNHPYCRRMIPPKLEKFRQAFADKLRK